MNRVSAPPTGMDIHGKPCTNLVEAELPIKLQSHRQSSHRTPQYLFPIRLKTAKHMLTHVAVIFILYNIFTLDESSAIESVYQYAHAGPKAHYTIKPWRGNRHFSKLEDKKLHWSSTLHDLKVYFVSANQRMLHLQLGKKIISISIRQNKPHDFPRTKQAKAVNDTSHEWVVGG